MNLNEFLDHVDKGLPVPAIWRYRVMPMSNQPFQLLSQNDT
jgi:hypothetical protein